jgi:molecular chaperone GrpE
MVNPQHGRPSSRKGSGRYRPPGSRERIPAGWLIRALADAENARWRAERTAVETRQYAIADLARELLVVADNLRRTIVVAERHAAATVQDAALIEGVRATERILERALEHFGIKKIDALGKKFDPSLHEAVMEVDETSQPPKTVIQVVEDGYSIRDRLLRPARVFVAKGGSVADPSERELAEAQKGFRSGGHRR